MRSRMKRREKPRDGAKPKEDTGLGVSLADDPVACSADTKPEFRVLCASVSLLFLDSRNRCSCSSFLEQVFCEKAYGGDPASIVA